MKIDEFPDDAMTVVARRPGKGEVEFTREGHWWVRRGASEDPADVLASDWQIVRAMRLMLPLDNT